MEVEIKYEGKNIKVDLELPTHKQMKTARRSSKILQKMPVYDSSTGELITINGQPYTENRVIEDEDRYQDLILVAMLQNGNYDKELFPPTIQSLGKLSSTDISFLRNAGLAIRAEPLKDLKKKFEDFSNLIKPTQNLKNLKSEQDSGNGSE